MRMGRQSHFITLRRLSIAVVFSLAAGPQTAPGQTPATAPSDMPLYRFQSADAFYKANPPGAALSKRRAAPNDEDVDKGLPRYKLSTDLMHLLERLGMAPTAGAARRAAPTAGRPLAVDITTRDVDGLSARLETEFGCSGAVAFGPVVSARCPADALLPLAEEATVLQIRSPRALTQVGEVTSQGDRALRADRARRQQGIDGRGVTVGVLSDSFDRVKDAGCEPFPFPRFRTYAQDVASGDLPDDVLVLQEAPECTPDNNSFIDEGRAMAQLIHDLAPGSELAFHTAFNGIADFAVGILELAIAGADVIVDDVIYFAEPMFQDGIIAQAVDIVAGAGVPYFSSAGNGADRSYQDPFDDSGLSSAFDGVLHDFDPGPGVDPFFGFTLQPGQSSIIFALQWDEPHASASLASPGAANDVDVYLTLPDGTPIVDSNGVPFASLLNNLGADPVEIVGIVFSEPLTQPISLALAISLFDGSAPGLLKFVVFRRGTDPLFDVPLASPTSYGHSNAAGGQGVGAAYFAETPAFGQWPPLPEPFTALGGVPILFSVDGERLRRPLIRPQPDITAVDGTNTTFFTADDDTRDFVDPAITDDDDLPNFFGTSASAPHAAAVAALMLAKNPDLRVDTVYRLLAGSAIDMERRGFDFLTGAGLIQADRALRQVPPPPRPSLSTAPRPILECVFDDADGGLVAVFGYQNDNGQTVSLPVGSRNRFTPPPLDRGQPVVFRPGRVQAAFAAPFAGDELTWTLFRNTATASRDSERCGFEVTRR